VSEDQHLCWTLKNVLWKNGAEVAT